MALQHSQYLESKILTAPSHRLHLMLIEGAIRFCRQAETELDAGIQAAAAGPMMRALDIVGELLAGVRQNESELNDKLVAVYWFIFCRASEAAMHSNSVALSEVLRLLEFERETWQKVCENLSHCGGSASPPSARGFAAPRSMREPLGISLQA